MTRGNISCRGTAVILEFHFPNILRNVVFLSVGSLVSEFHSCLFIYSLGFVNTISEGE